MSAILSILGEVTHRGQTFWMPEQASTSAASVDFTFDVINWICYFFFLLIVVIMVVFVWKYRRREHAANVSGPVHHLPLELAWTIIPLILVIVIFVMGMRGYLDLQEAPEGSYEVQATAQKWSWTFTHPTYGVIESAELTVPEGRPVRILITSQDVLHSLFIPAFRVKMDALPGRFTSLWFEAVRSGDFQLYCTEYCGKDHSLMLATVHVLPEDQFEAHMLKLAREYEDLPLEVLPAYAINRLYNRCKSCHSLDGTTSTGPSFKGLWDRTTSGRTVFTDGSQMSDHDGEGGQYQLPENYIRESLLKPQQHIVQGYTGGMPSFQGQLKERQITAVIEMFKHLDELVDENGRILVNRDGTPVE